MTVWAKLLFARDYQRFRYFIWTRRPWRSHKKCVCSHQ